jgi:hypothetical protein
MRWEPRVVLAGLASYKVPSRSILGAYQQPYQGRCCALVTSRASSQLPSVSVMGTSGANRCDSIYTRLYMAFVADKRLPNCPKLLSSLSVTHHLSALLLGDR